jgi:hypothetical protein
MVLAINALQRDITLVTACRNEFSEQLACTNQLREDLETKAKRLKTSQKNLKGELKQTAARGQGKKMSVIRSSKSWRLTAPLRKIAANLSRG